MLGNHSVKRKTNPIFWGIRASTIKRIFKQDGLVQETIF